MPPVPPPSPVVTPKLVPGAVPPQRAVTAGDKARARGLPPAPSAQQSVHIPPISTPEADAAAAIRAAKEQAERDEATRMAEALRAEQRALAEAQAQANRERAAAEEEEKAAAARLNAFKEFQRGPARAMAALSGIEVPVEDGDDEVFAPAEAAFGGGPTQPAQELAAEPDGFNVNECLGTTGGVAESWSLNDALFEPIVYSVEFGYEYRVVTQAASGDFVVRRYFVGDADQYNAFTIGLGRPMPNSHFTHCGSNFVLFGSAILVFYSPPALERALRINERLANQATPEQEIARLIAGTPGLDGRTVQAFAAQHASLTQPAPQPAPAPSPKPAPAPIRRK